MALPFINPGSVKIVNSINNNPQIKRGFVNLGDPSINTNTELSKGLEKVIALVAKFIIKAQASTIGLLYGKFEKQNSNNAITRALDRGILDILNVIAGVDFCNIVNYLIGRTNSNKTFDPNQRPINAGPFENAKWSVQKVAFDTQSYIDQYYKSYIEDTNQDARQGLQDLITKITQKFQSILGQAGLVNDPILTNTFPELKNASSFLNDTLLYLNQYSDVRQLPISEIKKILNLIDKIKFYCISIQALNNPAAALNFIDQLSGNSVQREINKINKIIPLEKLILVLRQILKIANNINSIARKILGYINLLRTLIKILTLIIKAISFIIIFFKANPIPSLFGTKGTDTTINDIFQNTIKEVGQKKSIKRLRQIDAVLSLMAGFVSVLIAGMYEIILKLNLIQLNIESCEQIDNDLKQDIQNTINNLADSINNLQDFLDKYNRAKENREKKFGNYTIQILEEQLTDEGISLKRRYGIARGRDNYIVVQTTPTFASLDLIIINEVKVLLVSKGLVTPKISSLDTEDYLAVEDAIRFLDEEEINIDDLQITEEDEQTIQEQDEIKNEIDGFINNLPGGRKLRKKVRQLFAKQSKKLNENLQQTDPNNKFVSSIADQTTSTMNQTDSANTDNGEDTLLKEIEKLSKRKAEIRKILSAIDLASKMTSEERNKLRDELKSIDRRLSELEKTKKRKRR